MQIMQSRRRFLASVSLAGTAGLVGAERSLHAEPPPETTTVRLAKVPAICWAPQYAADELLRAEGFTDVRYVEVQPGAGTAKSVASGEVDFSSIFVSSLISSMDAGEPVTAVAGVHTGCFELFGREGVQGITDLKGRSVGVPAMGSGQHLFLASMASYVGLDPVKDINWAASPSVKPMDLFADGQIDAFLGHPPEPQELRARKIGHVVVNTSLDRPWSQYFCCMLAGNRTYVRENPAAAKHAVRAILKAVDLCAAEPDKVARRLVEEGYAAQYEYALQALSDIPYARWRDYDPEDTIRFYALRLHEAGMVKSNPQKIIAEGTDWRFLDEIKRELKT